MQYINIQYACIFIHLILSIEMIILQRLENASPYKYLLNVPVSYFVCSVSLYFSHFLKQKPFLHILYTTTCSKYIVTLLRSNMYMYIYIVHKYCMYKSNQYYICICIHCNYIAMFLLYAYTLVCDYVKVQLKKEK